MLYLQTNTATPLREKLAGAFRYLAESGWNVQLVEANPKPHEVADLLRKGRTVGCIVDRGLARGRNPVRLFRGIPTVYFDQSPYTALRDEWCVLHDSAATVRLAYAELARGKPVHYAFVKDARDTYWSREREEALAALVGADRFSSFYENDRLVDILPSLPKPCGLVGANDFIARKALYAANRAGVDVPGELRVVGISNDTFLCEHTRPTLTSVHPDFETGGYLAMATLHRLVRGTTARPKTILFGPKEIVHRNSTRLVSPSDGRVRRALDYIAAHFADPNVTADHVAAAMGCSRRLADLRFRETTRHTIRDEIRLLRMKEAKRLLQSTDIAVTTLATRCGYLSAPTFLRTFKSVTGLSPQKWLATHRSRRRKRQD